jgi:hypothetical protein
MTQSPADVELTPEAAARLDDYLRQVRAALAGSADVNPDEIEGDIREHVGNELHDAPRPVSVPALDEVLARLGPPSQWGAGGDPTLLLRARHLLRDAKVGVAGRLRSAREALWRGPEDRRLAYLSFGVFALGVLSFFVLFPVTLPVSYLLSRAGIAWSREKGVALDAGRKWLLYPPVVLVSLMLLIALVAWPVALGGWVGEEVARARGRVEFVERPNPMPPAGSNWRKLRDWQDRQAAKERMGSQVEEDRALLAAIPVRAEWKPAAAGLFVGSGALALWLLVLGTAGATYPGAARAAFFPLLNHFERRHGAWTAAVCLVLLIPWGLTAYEVAAALM